jgi:hypothetical protein
MVRLRIRFGVGAKHQPSQPPTRVEMEDSIRTPQLDVPRHIWVVAEARISAARSLASLCLGAKLGAIRGG